MKILIASKNSLYRGGSVGGAETSMKLLAEKLAEIGHEVTYFTRGSSPVRKKKMKIEGVNVILYPYIRIKNHAVLPNILYRIIAGISSRINSKRMNNIAHSDAGITATDVVYTYYELPVLKFFSALKEQPAYTFKMVMRMAGLYWYEDIRKNETKKQIYQQQFNNLDCVNFISEGIKLLTQKRSEELGMYLNFRDHFVLDIGAKLEEEVQRAKENDNDKFTILCAGRFSFHAKRQDILVEAARLLRNKNRIRIKLIGEGENKNNIENLIHKYQLESIISLHPFMKQEQLRKEMDKADLLCHPCDHEGLGKIIVESMARGLPVMGSDVVPLNLYIKDGESGYLVENQPAAWAKKLDNILLNRTDLPRISKKAKAYAEEFFNPQKNVLLYEEVFSKMIDLG